MTQAAGIIQWETVKRMKKFKALTSRKKVGVIIKLFLKFYVMFRYTLREHASHSQTAQVVAKCFCNPPLFQGKESPRGFYLWGNLKDCKQVTEVIFFPD